MSRRSRRLPARLVRATAFAAGAAFVYQRWQLRSFGVRPASAYQPAASSSDLVQTPGATDASASTPRAHRWSRLQSSSPEKPFDVCVIGCGLTGLYTAVDAAQRGLRVALIDAADVGGGATTSGMPAVSPGAFPYVQRAIRQRDVGWLRVAMMVMEEEATWRSVAGWCVRAPETLMQRLQRRLRQVSGFMTRKESSFGGGDERASATSVRPATTLLPAWHSLEMLEYVCGGMLSTILSAFCGPLQFTSFLSAAEVERRLPALSPSSSVTSSSPTVRVKGGVVTPNLLLESHTAAVALAATAEELGVTLCTYAPVVHIREEIASKLSSATFCNEGSGGKSNGRRRSSSRWFFGRSVHRESTPETPLLAVHVCDALATNNTGLHNGNQCQCCTLVLTASSWFSRWFNLRAAVAVTNQRDALSDETSSSAASSAVVYTRSVVNCAGCSVDEVNRLFEGNARDTVPTAFEGYWAYSYLVAPADAVSATQPLPVAAEGGENIPGYTVSPKGLHPLTAQLSTPPLSYFTRTTGLHFGSPRLSFASAMVLPWWDQCVLLGPSVTPLPHLRPTESTGGPTQQNSSQRLSDNTNKSTGLALDDPYVIQSKDGYAAQRERILSVLAGGGVTVDSSRLLSCVSQIVPYVKSPKEAPFQKELLEKGYAFRFTSVPLVPLSFSSSGLADVSTMKTVGTKGVTSEDRRDVAFLHVYGGSPVLARRIAEDAVDALLKHDPPLFSEDCQSQLQSCRTRHLQLTVPSSLVKSDAASSASASSLDAVTRLQALIRDTYAERLVDVVARRTHVAYTSPDDALAALHSIATVMSELKGWSKERAEAEVAAARRLITSVAVTTPTTAS